MDESHEGDPLAVALIGEIIAVEQMARVLLARSLPKGMEMSHFMVLNHFARLGGEKTPAQLARTFHVTKGAMTNTISRLQAAGYVHVRPDWDDGRRKFVSLSPAGAQARDQAAAAITPVFENIIGTMGSDAVRAALPFLRSLRQHLSLASG
ncbi:MAG: MarR family winged helix-turn-helix transcriptional regulator [Paracoccaceae bacterium]